MIDLEKMAKEHEKLFPNASMESQVFKLDEEVREYIEAEDEEKIKRERADIIIVCCGLYRWFPRLAEAIAAMFYDATIKEEIIRKWEINKRRKWEWNGKTYKHVGKDGNE